MIPKIATCCYCGTRAALVLDTGLHELTCGSCGAPLHEMKFMPIKPRREAIREIPVQSFTAHRPKRQKYKRPKRRRSPIRFEDLWGFAEDFVEEIFD